MHFFKDQAGGALLVGAIVFCAALFGILSRPIGFLAAIWPANAILLGLFIAIPRFRTPASWLTVALGYLLAGYVAGDQLSFSLWMTSANLGGVATGVICFKCLSPEDHRLSRPLSMLYLLMVSVLASTAASLIGAGVSVILQSSNLTTSFAYWFTAELSNYVITLPVLLTAHTCILWRDRWPTDKTALGWLSDIAPLCMLGLSVLASLAIGGAGAIAFAVPALLWCSLRYGIFANSVIVLLFSLGMSMANASGILEIPKFGNYLDETTSFRLGITMIAIGPLTVAIINAVQKDLLARLNLAATIDSLTKALTRGEYLGQSTALIRDSARTHSLALLMIDVDHFKPINDHHGHAAGDKVLVAITRTIAQGLRDNDLFGRLGGEEFGITLPNTSLSDAINLAERLRRSVEDLSITLDNGLSIKVTISIGLSQYLMPEETDLAHMLSTADAALYKSKGNGRNQVSVHSNPEPHPKPRARSAIQN